MSLTFLEAQISSYPDFSQSLSKCADFYRQKLWYQLTQEIESLVSNKKCPLNFFLFEEEFISDIARYLNVLSYASIIVKICDRYTYQNGSKFCEKALKWIETHYKKDDRDNATTNKAKANTKTGDHSNSTGTDDTADTTADTADGTDTDDRKAMALDEEDVRDVDVNGQTRKLRVDIFCAKLLIRCQIAYYTLQESGFKDCRNELLRISDKIAHNVYALPPIVYAHFHFVYAKMYRSLRLYAKFYQHSIKYLSYCATIYGGTRVEWAKDMCVAALMDENFFDFGELSLHPILRALKETPFAWILAIVDSFIVADIQQYRIAIENMDADMDADVDVAAQQMDDGNGNGSQSIVDDWSVVDRLIDVHILNAKIELLCLVRLAFDKPSNDKILVFAEIECKCHASIEILVMRAMSLKLLQGVIDGIGQTFTIKFISPRILDMQEIRKLEVRMGDWIQRIDNSTKEIF